MDKIPSISRCRDYREQVEHLNKVRSRHVQETVTKLLIEAKKRKDKRLADYVAERVLTPIQRWRRIARIVRRLCGVCIALREYAMDAGLMENYMVSVTRKARTDDDMDELTFNLKDFRIRKESGLNVKTEDGIEFDLAAFKAKIRQREELNVPPSIIHMMEKNPDDRTESDLTSIGRLMKNLPSFRKYTSTMQRLFCKIVRYTKCGKRRIVLRKGHIGYNLYFIYSGAVSVVLDKDEGNVFVKPEVVVLRKGACFGEIALLQHTRRNATVVCSEEAELLFVEKEDFLANGLHLAMEAEFQQRYRFFRKWKALESWPDQKVKDLSYVSRMEEFNHNKVIVKDSKKNEWLWFVIRGSCDVLRLVDLEKCPEYRRVVLHGHKIEDYLMDNTRKKRHKYRAQLSSSSVKKPKSKRISGKSRPLAVSTPDIQIQSASENTSSSGKGRANVSFSEATNSKSSLGSSMYSQQPIDDENEHDVTESESDDDDLIPKDANVKEVNPMKVERPKGPDIGQGIFVKVDELRDGQCFGIEYLFDELEKPVTLSLVSKGCEVIHVPRSRFQEMCTDQSLAHILLNCVKTYPSDDELCAKFLDFNQWDSYKSEVIEDLVVRQNTFNKYQSSLRDSAKRRAFYRMVDGLKDTGSSAAKSALALFDANQNSSLERSQDFQHVPRSMTSSGSRDDPDNSMSRMRNGSAGPEVYRRHQRPRTCPPGLRNNQHNKTTPVQRFHRTADNSMNTSHNSDNDRTLQHKAATETAHSKLMALTLRSRSCNRRARSSPSGGRVLVTRSGYRVTTTPVLASGSQRTIRLVESVKSPQHAHRIKLIKQR